MDQARVKELMDMSTFGEKIKLNMLVILYYNKVVN